MLNILDKPTYTAKATNRLSKAFLSVDGTAVSGTAHRIPFRSFTPEDICSQFSPETLDEELVLSYEKLALYLQSAEGEEELRKAGQARVKPLRAGMRMQMRASTPPEILSVEDEGEGRVCRSGKGLGTRWRLGILIGSHETVRECPVALPKPPHSQS